MLRIGGSTRNSTASLVLLLLLAACTTQLPTTAEQVELLETACSTCNGKSTVSLTTRGIFYTTPDAVCIRRDNLLTCGSCSCKVEPYETRITTDTTCTFTPVNGTLVPSC